MSLRGIKGATSLSALSAALRHTAATLKDDVNKIATDTADSLAFKLIYITPVDTSLALSNWRVGLVIPELDTIPAYRPGSDGNTASQSRSAAYISAKNAIHAKKPGTRLYISNNSKHIVELNQGKSPQQPTPNWIEEAEAQEGAQAQQKLRKLLDGN